MNDGEDNNGILLFPSSTTKIALFEPTLQAVESFKSLKFKSKLQKLDKTMMRKLAITGEQILFEAQHFLRPTPADYSLTLKKTRRRKPRKTRSERNRRSLLYK